MAHVFTDLPGVFAHAVAASIKVQGLDLAFIYIPDAVACAGVFTRHAFKAASVIHTQKYCKKHQLKAVIINAGNANAVTGKQGEKDTKTLAKAVATYLGIKSYEVGVAATGIIGVPLPLSRIETALPILFEDPKKKNGAAVAEAILTTDLCCKQVWKERQIGKKNMVVAGITKGSGMIAPNMATTLGFLVTNVAIDYETLQVCLHRAIEDSYNMLSVDTDTSTSDMVLCFATGQYRFTKTDPAQLAQFQALLTDACIDLARQIAKDGEGATKTIEVHVEGAASLKDARMMAKQVIDSPLVKTAIHGGDPNWGRLVMALGKNPEIKLNPNKVSISIEGIDLVKQGQPRGVSRACLKKALEKIAIAITINCGLGDARATAWGCDLTKGYIDINTDYN